MSKYRKRVPILQDFIERDWPRFQRFWLSGIWSRLPFVIITRKRLLNMHWDTADHAVSFTARAFERTAMDLEMAIEALVQIRNHTIFWKRGEEKALLREVNEQAHAGLNALKSKHSTGEGLYEAAKSVD